MTSAEKAWLREEKARRKALDQQFKSQPVSRGPCPRCKVRPCAVQVCCGRAPVACLLCVECMADMNAKIAADYYTQMPARAPLE